MIRFEKRIFTLEDIFEFLKSEIPGETPTGLIYDKTTGKFRKPNIKDFNNRVLVQNERTSNSWVELTNFSFIIDNYKNLSIKWMRFLLKKHKNEYAPMLKNYLEQNRNKVMKQANDKIEEFKQETLKAANARLFEHNVLENEVKEILDKGENYDNILG